MDHPLPGEDNRSAQLTPLGQRLADLTDQLPPPHLATNPQRLTTLSTLTATLTRPQQTPHIRHTLRSFPLLIDSPIPTPSKGVDHPPRPDSHRTPRCLCAAGRLPPPGDTNAPTMLCSPTPTAA